MTPPRVLPSFVHVPPHHYILGSITLDIHYIVNGRVGRRIRESVEDCKAGENEPSNDGESEDS